MKNPLKIKLTIANRVYPLSVAPDQEASLRKSAKKIEATIIQLEKNYAVRDKQDVLAMCSLQYAAQLEKSNNQKTSGFLRISTQNQKNLVFLKIDAEFIVNSESCFTKNQKTLCF